ncbi:MAG: hypothetical protein AAF789_04425, partial [Bacteroidota bacterium]
GFDYPSIIIAYDAAIESSLYDSVAFHTGNGNYETVTSYAKTNKLEYFAELTETYLGENDFFPFVRNELENHDSLGYQVLKSIWRFSDQSDTTQSSVGTEGIDHLLRDN